MSHSNSNPLLNPNTSLLNVKVACLTKAPLSTLIRHVLGNDNSFILFSHEYIESNHSQSKLH